LEQFSIKHWMTIQSHIVVFFFVVKMDHLVKQNRNKFTDFRWFAPVFLVFLAVLKTTNLVMSSWSMLGLVLGPTSWIVRSIDPIFETLF
jgi:hypothetical protein